MCIDLDYHAEISIADYSQVEGRAFLHNMCQLCDLVCHNENMLYLDLSVFRSYEGVWRKQNAVKMFHGFDFGLADFHFL
jgi:hypothetical protein